MENAEEGRVANSNGPEEGRGRQPTKGAHVKRGDVLLCLDDREYVAQTILAAASLEAARAEVEQAGLAADQAARDWIGYALGRLRDFEP